MSTIAVGLHTSSSVRVYGKRKTVPNRVMRLMLVVLLMLAMWYFSQLAFPGAVTGSSHFVECPGMSVHC